MIFRAISILLIAAGISFSQSKYFNNNSGFSTGFCYGKYRDGSRYDLTFTYSFLGKADIGYSGVGTLGDGIERDFTHEIIVSGYPVNSQNFAISSSLIYHSRKYRSTEIFNSNIEYSGSGIGFAAAFHFYGSNDSDKGKNFVTSIFFRRMFLNETTNPFSISPQKTTGYNTLGLNFSHLLNLGGITLAINPTAVYEIDRAKYFYGLGLKFLVFN
jgi:hypothetical protein